MAIQVYNTLTRTKQTFVPKEPQQVGIYVCGVTPYSETHLGHARPSVIWDVIKRYLRRWNYQVLHVQNFTDVDDKIIAKAQERGVDALELSAYYSQDYLESMDALGIERADVYPRVSEEMDVIIDMIETLVEQGHAYEAEGSVFFAVASFSEYGRLSNQRLEELQSGTRFEVDPNKRSAMDFALWKAAKPDEPSWDSPFGPGRPGWHIECSAMARKYLGENFDFHGGGTDLIFPHHENEIAQSKGATGSPGARYWLHSGMLNLKEEKMSKSTGHFLTIKEALQHYPKELLRFYVLSAHYRSELEFHDEKLDEVRRGWQRLNQFVRELRSSVGEELPVPCPLSGAEQQLKEDIAEHRRRFDDAMCDDFNTALAIAVLFDLMKVVRSYMEQAAASAENRYAQSLALQSFTELGSDVLGVVQWHDTESEAPKDGYMDAAMRLILDVRQRLRQEKNFELADQIRSELQDAGIVLEDTPDGTRWKVE